MMPAVPGRNRTLQCALPAQNDAGITMDRPNGEAFTGTG